MEVGTREHAYYMAQVYDYHIAYEIGTYGENNTKRLSMLNKKYEYWTALHNSYENTLLSSSKS